MDVVICTNCKRETEKSYKKFNFKQNMCKRCISQNWTNNNQEKTKELHKEYNLINKEQISKNKKDYYIKNKEKILQQRKESYDVSKQDNEYMDLKRKRDAVKTREWRERNKEKISEQRKQKKKNDPLYKLSDSIRTLIYVSINRVNYCKNKRTFDILGCDIESFKLHIESLF